MTMDSMVKYLESRGFTVSKRYDSSTKAYVFDVERDNQQIRQYFKYPGEVPLGARDRIQREFLDDIVKKFDGARAQYYNIADLYPSTMLTEQCEEWRKYLNEKIEKEREMARRINWKVQEIGSQTDSDGFAFYASLVGTPRGIFVGSMEDVKKDLETQIKEFNAAEMAAKYAMNSIYGSHALGEWPKQNPYVASRPQIKDVIFNDPATIVFWTDGSKTVVKCQEDDTFDPEKGLAMAIVKKVLGNKGNYCNEIKKWLPKETTSELKPKNDQTYCNLQAAYHVLYPALHDKKATKKEMEIAMEEALGYIGEALDK